MTSQETNDFIIPQKNDCMYTKCFCEENIWHLAKKLLDANKSTSEMKCYVIFMSNASKCVHIWKQDNNKDEGLVFWDYHVFLIAKHHDKTLAFDLDCTLPFPVPFQQYSKEALRNEFLNFQTKRYFRVIEAEKYLKLFSSDRRHMLKDDQWMSPPPSYPPILNKDQQQTLDYFISMESTDEYGEVMDLEKLNAKFF